MKKPNDASKAHRSILYVEDDPAVIQLFRIALGDLDLPCTVEIMTAGGADEALSVLRARTNDGSPDLVILDLHLPQRDGISLLKEIREINVIPRVPVVFFTTSNDRRKESEAIQAGAVAFLHKAGSFADFVDGVRAACRYLPATAA